MKKKWWWIWRKVAGRSGQASRLFRSFNCPSASPSSPCSTLRSPFRASPFLPDVLNLLSGPNWRQLFFLYEREGEKYVPQPFPSSPPLSLLCRWSSSFPSKRWGLMVDPALSQHKAGLPRKPAPLSCRRRNMVLTAIPPHLSPLQEFTSIRLLQNPSLPRHLVISICQ